MLVRIAQLHDERLESGALAMDLEQLVVRLAPPDSGHGQLHAQQSCRGTQRQGRMMDQEEGGLGKVEGEAAERAAGVDVMLLPGICIAVEQAEDMPVAGKRSGLDGAEAGLHVSCRAVVRQMRRVEPERPVGHIERQPGRPQVRAQHQEGKQNRHSLHMESYRIMSAFGQEGCKMRFPLPPATLQILLFGG